MNRFLFIVLLLGSTVVAEEPPKTMIKVEVVLQGPEIAAESFAAKPKVMYRAGNRYCRIEEAPDPEHGIHGLLIVNEPDAWMINLLAKTAKHIVDPGPTFNCRLPIFPDEADVKLEFGKEIEYFKGQGVASEKGPVMHAKQTMAYKLNLYETRLALFTYGDPERPLAVGRVRGEKGEVFWYSGYGDMAFDSRLFAKPENVKIEESKP